MKKYIKNFIGKGKQIPSEKYPNTVNVRVTLKLSDTLPFKYEKNGREYVTFELAALQEKDKYEHTHTAYVKTIDYDRPADKRKGKILQKAR